MIHDLFFFIQAVNNFKNETGYTKRVRKSVQNAAPPPPRLQLVRPLHSRQQDPLLANVSHLSSTSAPSSTTTTQVQVPAPSSSPASAPASAPAPARAPSPASAAPTPPHVAVEGKDASPAPSAVVDHLSPARSTNHGEPPPPG